MDFKLIINSLYKTIPTELVSIIIGYLYNYTNEPENGCITCKLSWDSYIHGHLKQLKDIPLYPVIIWNIHKFDIDYACSRKCKKIFYINELIQDEQTDRFYILKIEEFIFYRLITS